MNQFNQQIDFSLMFFSQMGDDTCGNPYQMITDITQLGDEYGFKAVWLPERHFATMGGIYPNPAVVAAYLAAQTKQIRIRAGSVVLPLHHAASVVEEWSVVDNLSNGRIDLAFASGWNPNDFILSPGTYPQLRETWIERIAEVRNLWEGKPQKYVNGKGEPIEITTYPRPVQSKLNYWLAISKSEESFRIAGEIGSNVLTMLTGSSLEQLADKIITYRDARERAGFDPTTGNVTLMLHSFVHWDKGYVHETVRAPFLNYIKDSVRSHLKGGAISLGNEASEKEINRLAEYSFERYFNTAALFGSVDSVQEIVERCKEVGVTEIACLMDFGVEQEKVMNALPYLRDLKDRNQ